MSSGERWTLRISRGDRRKLLLAGVLGSLVMVFGSAHGGFGSGRSLASGLDTVFSAAESVLPRTASPADAVDLGDGLSRVPARWQARFERFALSDREHPPVPGGIVFTGSSSIDFWQDLLSSFPGHDVTQRGLAGPPGRGRLSGGSSSTLFRSPCRR